jgi:hypothetical protein
VLFGFGVSVLFGHAKINDVNDVGRFGVWSTYQEIIGFDVAVDEVLFVDGLHSGELPDVSRSASRAAAIGTICFATITTVLMENRLLQ